MNEMIQLLQNHRSIRSFEEKKLTPEQIKSIVASAQAASTSSFIQAYSIIGVTDQDKKDQLAALTGGQDYVAKNGHFFVFCADLHRHDVIGDLEKKDVLPTIESTEKFMVALIDAALAAQNAVIAAESMGLGICYIGGIRNNLDAVSELLKTPTRVIPLFGMAVGYPKKVNDQKPRLPFEHIYHENEYNQDAESYKKQLSVYDEIISDYYQERTDGNRSDTWTGQMAQMLEKQTRMYMKDFVQKKGFDLK
jgi:FMN reductase (NADPH)